MSYRIVLQNDVEDYTEMLHTRRHELRTKEAKAIRKSCLKLMDKLRRLYDIYVDIEDGRVYFLNYDEWYARLDRFRGHKKHGQSTEPVLMSSAAAAGESREG